MFKGILTPVITVLDNHGNLDFHGNQIVINRLIDNGMDGLLFLGSIGEFFSLTMKEKKEFTRFVIQTVKKRVPVLIGTGGTIQKDAIELTQFAEKEGADGVVVISPYYFKLNSDTIYRYYELLARSTSLPIMLYNFPERTNADLDADLVLRLATEFKHIVAIKDTVDNISHTRKLIQVMKTQRPEFCVLSGFDEYLIPNLLAGGDGVIGGLTNVAPELFSALKKSYFEKNFEEIAAVQAKICILMNLYEATSPFVAAIKGAVSVRESSIIPFVKEPAVLPTQQQLLAIKEILAKAGIS